MRRFAEVNAPVSSSTGRSCRRLFRYHECVALDVDEELWADITAPRFARRILQRAFRGLGCEHEVVLIGSELVAHAVLYGRTPIRLRAARESGYVRVEVTDAQPTQTHQSRHSLTLALVRRVADRSGTEARTDGRMIWAEIRCADAQPRPNHDRST